MNETFSSEQSGCMGSNVDPSCDCKPKNYLTQEEEAILNHLREIKEHAHRIMAKMNTGGEREHTGESENFTGLSSELDQLRQQWSEWADRLDQAMDRKMVMLGHKDPSERNAEAR